MAARRKKSRRAPPTSSAPTAPTPSTPIDTDIVTDPTATETLPPAPVKKSKKLRKLEKRRMKVLERRENRAKRSERVPGAARTSRTTKKIARAQARVRKLIDVLQTMPEGKRRTKLMTELSALLRQFGAELPAELVEQGKAVLTQRLVASGDLPPAVLTDDLPPGTFDPSTLPTPTGDSPHPDILPPDVAAAGANLDLIDQILGGMKQGGKKNKNSIKIVIKRLEQVMGDKNTLGKKAILAQGDSDVVSGKAASGAFDGSTASFRKKSPVVGEGGFGTFGRSRYVGEGGVMVAGKNPKVVGPYGTGLFAGSQQYDAEGNPIPTEVPVDEYGNPIQPDDGSAGYPIGYDPTYMPPPLNYYPTEDGPYDPEFLPADLPPAEFGYMLPYIPTDMQQHMPPPMSAEDLEYFGYDPPSDMELLPWEEYSSPFSDIQYADAVDFDPYTSGVDPEFVDDIDAQEALDLTEQTLGDIQDMVGTRLLPRVRQLVADAKATGDRTLYNRARAIAYAAKNAMKNADVGLSGCSAVDDGLSGPLVAPGAIANAARAVAPMARKAFQWLVAGLAFGAGNTAGTDATKGVGEAIKRGLMVGLPLVGVALVAQHLSGGRR